VLGLLLYAASGFDGVPFPMIFQLATILLFGFGTFVLLRFVLKKFVFEIRENGERTLDFIVTEIVGKKQTVVARLALAKISAVRVLERKELKRELSGMRATRPLVYRYSNFADGKACVVEFPDENAWIICPVDEKMVELLEKNIGGDKSDFEN
jgi:hypothetical protein